MDRLQRMLASGQLGGMGGPAVDSAVPDTAETIYISSLALLKMLKHGRAGVPVEVMGLMLGKFVDEYTVHVVDVFAMPQTATGVSVEAVDPVYQQEMLELLKQTMRQEMVIGWYHSHPGIGCWLSGVDVNTQQAFEQLNPKAVAVVVDPIQSVRGKVVMDAFRLINPASIAGGQEPRQTTSNIGHISKPSIQAMIHGVNRSYYQIRIANKKNEFEAKMLMNLHKKDWSHGLKLDEFEDVQKTNEDKLGDLHRLAKDYKQWLLDEQSMSDKERAVHNVGKIDPKRHLSSTVDELMSSNIVQTLTTMLDTIVF